MTINELDSLRGEVDRLKAERWVHFSNELVIDVYDCDPQEERKFHKPEGLWISDEAAEQSWSQWCASEEFRACHEQFAHLVTLSPDANILRLDSVADIHGFTRCFKISDSIYRSINWPEVMRIYDGILITPYQWDCRLSDDTGWYYSWDCASGCIWRSSAISSIEEIDAAEFAPAFAEGHPQ